MFEFHVQTVKLNEFLIFDRIFAKSLNKLQVIQFVTFNANEKRAIILMVFSPYI